MDGNKTRGAAFYIDRACVQTATVKRELSVYTRPPILITVTICAKISRNNCVNKDNESRWSRRRSYAPLTFSRRLGGAKSTPWLWSVRTRQPNTLYRHADGISPTVKLNKHFITSNAKSESKFPPIWPHRQLANDRNR